jgi:hypothetical protein
MRKFLTLLAAAGLMIGTAAAAHADTPVYLDNCSATVTVAPNITAKTCVHASIYTAAYVSANVTVVNTSPYTLAVRADLLALSTTIVGDTVTVPPNTSTVVYGNSVTNPPGLQSDWLGRGYLQTGSWSTYTYSR